MKNENTLIPFVFLLLIIVLFSTLVIAQENNQVYEINLNYKKQGIFESLNLVDIQVKQGIVPDTVSQSDQDYRLDIISVDNLLLKSVRFNVPFGSIIMKGMVNDSASGSANDMNFKIPIPYYNSAKILNIYDKNNNKVLDILLNPMYDQEPHVEIDGVLEVIHEDDFEHPKNSRFNFYLRTSSKRYALESDRQLPVVLSGTPVRVKGKILGDKILVNSLELLNPSQQLKQETADFKQLENLPPKESSKLHIDWIFVLMPVLLILSYLTYLEMRRIKSHKSLEQQRQQQSNIALRNYVAINLRKGYNKEQIRSALIKNNYSNEEFEEAFKGLK